MPYDAVYNKSSRRIFIGTPEDTKKWLLRFSKYHDGLHIRLGVSNDFVTVPVYLSNKVN